MIRIYKNVVFWIFISSAILVYGQNDTFSTNVSDCFGAVQMEINRPLKPKIPVNNGQVDDLQMFSEALEFSELNSLWFRFESKHSGTFSFQIQNKEAAIEYGVFLLNKGQDCSAIHQGDVELLIHKYLKKSHGSFVSDSILYAKGQTIIIFVNTPSTKKNEFEVQADFNEKISNDEFLSLQKTFDFRTAKNKKPFSIKVRDAKTKLPIIANILISESRTHNALYNASDIIFPYSDNLKMNLNIDATGYFFQDVSINTRKNKTNERIIYLKALEHNQLIELEGLVFESQSDALLEEALPKLKRLKDFMVMNSTVKIEIQGHVHFDGKNSFKAKQLSRKRAKTIKDYLIANGIDKSRISTVGFGNEKMRYPAAQTDAEKQANRRVEVKIL